MIPFKSNISKLSIYATFSEEDLIDVTILHMNGVKVQEILILNSSFDYTNKEGIIEGILEEETDSRFIDKSIDINIINVSHERLFIEEIYNFLTKITNSNEIDYIVYNENLEFSEFYDELQDFIYNYDDSLSPTHLSDIYMYPDINDLLKKFDIKDHMHSKDSTISNALYTGIFLDISLGR